MKRTLPYLVFTALCFIAVLTTSAQNLGITTPGTTAYPTTNIGNTQTVSNGTITIAASGGIAPYSFSIDNGANYSLVPIGNTKTFTGLSPGIQYTIKVKDNVGCVSK